MKVEVTDVVPVLPAGIHDAIFKSITAEHNDNGDFYLWVFSAQDGDGNFVDITGTTSPKITPRTKSAKWLAGLGVGDIKIGQSVDFDELVDMPVQLVIVINDAGYSRIENVLPYPTAVKPVKVKS
jgi:hypothetical protein